MNRYFGNRTFYRHVLSIMLPIVLQQGITNLVSLLDNIMVGQVGTEQMSGVAISNQLLFVFQLCVFGSLSGAGIFCAQYFGKGDQEKVRSVFRYKVLSTILITVLAIAIFCLLGSPLICLFLTDTGNSASIEETLRYGLQYLRIMLIGLVPFAAVQLYSSTMRETGETVIPMRASLTAVLVNMVGNYLLIFGHLGLPRMGVAGAAVATVISRFVELAMILYYARTRQSRFPYFRGIYKTLSVPGELAVEITKKGMPLLFNELLWSAGTTIIVQCYSTCGLNAVAAYNISSTVSNLFFLAGMAMGNAISIIVGQELGAGLTDRARDSARKLLTMATLLCLCVSGVMALTAPLFPRIYNTIAEVRDLARSLLLLDACFMTFRSLYNCSYFALRSGGKSLLTFLFDSCSMWIINIPLAFCLAHFTGLTLLPMYVVLQSLDVLKTVLGLYLVHRGIWVHNLTV